MRVFISALFFLIVLCLATPSSAQEQINLEEFPKDEFFKGNVVSVLDKGDDKREQASEIVQQLRVRILTGAEKNTEITALNNIPSNTANGLVLKGGETIVGVKTVSSVGTTYYIADRYRLNSLGGILIVFLSLVLFFGRIRGLMSILGLAFSILLLVWYVVPHILSGKDPLFVSITGATAIMFVSLYLAHGFKKRTTIALVSTLLTLGLASALAVLFVHVAHLFGTGTEEALYLQLGPLDSVNLRGLLLGGIIIGTLGVLDDITTAQTAAVEELKKANAALTISELYRRGLSIGKEHIASLVNTLALAYAGVSLPLFLLFSLNQTQPFWVILNSESIAEEVVRTLVGSAALTLAVPITTALAAWYFGRVGKRQKKKDLTLARS